MPLPTLTNWRTTGESLHRAAQILGTIRAKSIQPLPNHLHLCLTIRPEGLSTGPLPAGELRLDYSKAELVYLPADSEPVTLGLAGQSQATLTRQVLQLMADHDHAIHLTAQEAAHVSTLQDTTPLTVDPDIGADYAQVIYRIFTATARFRARFFAPMTPVVVWPEHYDLSFLLFTTDTADEAHPHMNFGFAPYSEGFERPYLYSYAYPLPEGYQPPQLPPPARWNTQPWTGVVVPYDDFAQVDDPEAFVEDIFMHIQRELAAVLDR